MESLSVEIKVFPWSSARDKELGEDRHHDNDENLSNR